MFPKKYSPDYWNASTKRNYLLFKEMNSRLFSVSLREKEKFFFVNIVSPSFAWRCGHSDTLLVCEPIETRISKVRGGRVKGVCSFVGELSSSILLLIFS